MRQKAALPRQHSYSFFCHDKQTVQILWSNFYLLQVKQLSPVVGTSKLPEVTSLALSPDGHKLAAGHSDGSLRWAVHLWYTIYWLGMSQLRLLCNHLHNVRLKFIWIKGNQQSDLGNLPILLFTANLDIPNIDIIFRSCYCTTSYRSSVIAMTSWQNVSGSYLTFILFTSSCTSWTLETKKWLGIGHDVQRCRALQESGSHLIFCK